MGWVCSQAQTSKATHIFLDSKKLGKSHDFRFKVQTSKATHIFLYSKKLGKRHDFRLKAQTSKATHIFIYSKNWEKNLIFVSRHKHLKPPTFLFIQKTGKKKFDFLFQGTKYKAIPTKGEGHSYQWDWATLALGICLV